MKNRLTTFLAAASAAAGLTFFAGCDNGNPSDVLVIGMELSYPPFELKDETGKPVGISVDMAEALSEHLGMPLEIRDMSFTGLIPALETDRVDCIISSMTITTDRAKQISFSDPYVKTGICMLVQKNGGILTVDQLNQKGRRVACKTGTTGHIFAEEHLPEADLAVFEDHSLCALEVHQGKSDAFIYDQISIAQFAFDEYPETTKAYLAPIQVETWGVGVRKGNQQLLDDINAFIKMYREKGGFDALADKWMSDSKANFEQLGVEFVF
ncbi:MAG: polar amino acid transport system substrate-binding protein [Verrucomicrobiales bacterium]|jgi:polar amino acid transport system substrate-binding protein